MVTQKFLGFVWHGSTYSTHHTANFSDWPVCPSRPFSFVMTYFMISQPISTFTQWYLNHIYFLHIHTQCQSHICCIYLGAYATNQGYSTTGKYSHKTRHTSSVGVMRYLTSQPISTPTPQNYHHLHFITYMFGSTQHFSMKILGHIHKAEIVSPWDQKKKSSAW